MIAEARRAMLRRTEAGRSVNNGAEGDAGGIEAIKTLMGRKFASKHEMLWRTAVLAGPEPDEAEDLLGLFALEDVGVRVAPGSQHPEPGSQNGGRVRCAK